MKAKLLWSIILTVSCFVWFACESYRNSGGTDWVSVDFSVGAPAASRSDLHFSTSGDSVTLIIAVPASSNTVTTDNYLPANFDRQLLNIGSNTVSLSVPLNVSMRLIKVVFDETPTLSVILSTLPEASSVGISDAFTILAGESSKTITIVTTGSSVSVSAVTPLYTAGSSWNSYLKNDGDDIYSATGTACVGDETSFDACFHAGAMRVLEMAGYTSCTGLTAVDSESAFQWTCSTTSSGVRFISTAFNVGKSLSSLIDFSASTPGWKSMTVTVLNQDTEVATTAAFSWADNTVTVNNNGGSLATEGVVYIVTSNPAADYTIDADKVALLISPSIYISGSGSADGVIFADGRRFIWIEGNVDGSNNTLGVNLSSTRFSAARNLTVFGATGTGLSDACLYLSSARYNILEYITTLHCKKNGIYTDFASYNRFTNVISAHNESRGIYASYSGHNLFQNLKLILNWNTGIYFAGNLSEANVVDSVLSAGNYKGINFYNAKDNIISRLTSFNNDACGLAMTYSANNLISNVTSANNSGNGISIAANGAQAEYFSIINSVTTNNTIGVYLEEIEYSLVHNLVTVSNSQYGIDSESVNDGTYSGFLKVGDNTSGDCEENSGSTPGIDSSCVSDATHIDNVNLASTFRGKLTTDDSSNTSDTDGQATYPTNINGFDWSTFENDFRGWGIDHADAFPSANHTGSFGCSSPTQPWGAADTAAACGGLGGTWNGTGRIWDWSLRSSDANVLNVFSLPTGNDYLTHTWSDASTTQHLKNAVEILLDDIGNDNTLCESNEACLFTPNVGAYQGHGLLVTAGTFTDGTLTGITLMKYASNGY